MGVLRKAFAPHFSPVNALQNAHASIYNGLLQQANLWAYMEVFHIIAWGTAGCVLGTILFKNVKSKGPAPAP